jgi:hypothetical protein
MTAEDDFLGIVDKVLIEIEDIKGQLPGITAKQKNDAATGAANFEFRPLTEEEKKEFTDSLDAKGKQPVKLAWPR